MNKKIDCDIIRDLLPSYMDGLTNETTNKAVAEHLEQCSDCKETLRLMHEPEPSPEPSVPEVDYLKKVRRRSSRAGIICGIIMMLIGMLIIFSKVFLIGTAADATDANFNVSVSGNTVYISGSLAGSTTGVSRVVFEESAGIVTFKVYTAPKTFFNSSEIDAQYQANADLVGMVKCRDFILWSDGVSISSVASQLYEAANPFVGDMPSNQKIASILGVAYQFGGYSSELHTDHEPYGWTISLITSLSADEEDTAMDIMTADSYAMLATIENLGYVEWEFKIGGSARKYTVTAQDATSSFGKDIKQCISSVTELEKLMESLSIKWSGVKDIRPENPDSFNITIRNNSSFELYSFGLNYYLNGKLIGTRTVENADKSPLKKGEEFVFDFLPEDFPNGTSEIALSKFSFDLSVTEKDGTSFTVTKNATVDAKYAWSYFFSLNDGFGVPFVLSEE